VIESLNLHHVDGEEYHKDGKGAVVWRATFDKYILDLAIQAGAAFEEQSPLLQIEETSQDISAGDYPYVIHTPSKTLHSRFVIAADGVNSPTLKQLGFPAFTNNDLVLTITREARVGADKIAECLGSDSVHLFFGCENFISMGYAWLFPKEDTISVGWGNLVSKIRDRRVRDAYQIFLDLPICKEVLQSAEILRDKPHMIPVGARAGISRNGVLGVGDAIGAVDPISGKGIPYALMSGQVAAQTIKAAENKGKLDRLPELYARAINSKFGAVLKQKGIMRNKIFSSDEMLKHFLDLWQTHHSSEILAKKLL
jgi:flavin-dependent dehydrogenase